MKILYLGHESGTALQRILALRRLGHDVAVIDPDMAIKYLAVPFVLINAWAVRTGAFGLAGVFQHYVRSQMKGASFDLAFVDHGFFLGPATIKDLRKAGKIVVNFNQDNPYVQRDGLKWRFILFLKALPLYDLVVTPRVSCVELARRAGARRVIAVNFAADEAVHRPIELNSEDRAGYAAEVVFIGAWMPERGPFLVAARRTRRSTAHFRR